MPIRKGCYGFIRGLPSRKFPRLSLTSYPELPSQYDLTLERATNGNLNEPPIWDQGQTNSCTGHSSTGGVAYARARENFPYLDLSRLFTYWNARVEEGTESSDSGAVVADVISAAQDYGVCLYSDLPTEEDLTTVQPNAATFQNAVYHKSLDAVTIQATDDVGLAYYVKHMISIMKIPVIFGFTVYESFEDSDVANTGVVHLPGPNEDIIGGHSVRIVAYDDTKQQVKCANSWNTDWGQKGYFVAPYAYLLNQSYSSDFHGIII